MSEQLLIGLLMCRLDFWTSRYEFSLQVWGNHGYNMYIQRANIELTSFGENSLRECLETALEWCEKANPRIKYPNTLGSADIALPE